MRFPFLNKRITPLIPITVLLFLSLVILVFFLPPTTMVPLGIASVSLLVIFFPIVFLFCFGIGTLLFRSRFNGLLLGLFVISYLTLRFNDFDHPLFLILLAAFFITLEFFFAQSHKNTQPPTRKAKEE